MGHSAKFDDDLRKRRLFAREIEMTRNMILLLTAFSHWRRPRVSLFVGSGRFPMSLLVKSTGDPFGTYSEALVVGFSCWGIFGLASGLVSSVFAAVAALRGLSDLREEQ